MAADLHLKYLTFDTPDPMAIASFWGAMHGVEPQPTVLGARILPNNGPWMLFLPVPESKTAKNRFHPDFNTGDLDEVFARVIAEDGSGLEDHRDESGYLSFRDPDGNEFCVGQQDGAPLGLNFAGPTFDTASPTPIARWWASVLGGDIADHPDGIQVAVAGRPRWLFMHVPEPKTAKNRCHPDLHTPHLDTEVERVLDLGAVETARFTETSRFVVFLDPDGNEFCIVEDASPDPTDR